MPSPYSADLRQRVLAACAAHDASRAALARRFRIGESTLYRWLEAQREEGRTTAKPHAGGPTSRFDVVLLRRLVDEAPDATLGELATRYAAESHAVISVSSVERLVQLLDLRRKKKDAPCRGARATGRGRGPHRVS